MVSAPGRRGDLAAESDILMPFTASATLARLPRVPLAYLPTPISPLSNLTRHLGGPELSIKRDDQTGLATGGNKTRKLEFLLGQAVEAGADTLITAGSVQSNHARQTAAAAAQHGLHCHLVLRGQPPEFPNGNLLLDHLLGATIHWTDEAAPYSQTIERVEEELFAAGSHPYIIPYGGSSPHGIMGYVAAMIEYAAQASALGAFDAHVFATSSGGTQAGMLLGAHLAGLGPETRILGISVDRPRDALAADVASLANQGAALLGVDWHIDARDILIDDGYRGSGYAVIGEPEREAIALLARTEGILLDPVYTARAMAGLLDLIRRRTFAATERILFWHTGGVPALFAFPGDLERAL